MGSLIIFEVKPSTNLVRFINSYKSASSRLIKKTVSSFKKEFYGKVHFGKQVILLQQLVEQIYETIRQYIEQREK